MKVESYLMTCMKNDINSLKKQIINLIYLKTQKKKCIKPGMLKEQILSLSSFRNTIFQKKFKSILKSQ